jgi:hypothetical protein
LGEFGGTINPSSLPASSTPYIVTYSYAGDSNFKSATDTTTTLTVNQAKTLFFGLTSRTVPYHATQISLGGAIFCNPSQALPSGQTVTIEIGTAANPNMLQTTCTITSIGEFGANFDNSTPLQVGIYTVTYSYAGDSNFKSATDNSTTLTVEATPAFSGLTQSQSTTYGTASIHVSGKLTCTPALPASQTVSIKVGNGTAVTATVAADGSFSGAPPTATLPASGTPYPITYSYAGSGGFLPVTDTSTKLTVNQATPVFSGLTSETVPYGTQSVNLGGDLHSSTSLAVPAGQTVTINVGTATNPALATGSATVENSYPGGFGPASIDIHTLSVGVYTVTYSYAGDSNFQSASDTSTKLTVNQASPVFSGLAASQTISYGASPITVSGTLAAPTAKPSGQQVTISVGGASANATVASDGTFTTTIDTHAIGAATTPYPITYSYAGDSNFQSASDSTTTTLTVNKDSTTTTIIASATSPSFGQTVTFTATVTANAPGSGTPAGLVDFVDTTTGNDLGTATLSGGKAALPISSLTPGSHTIQANYEGDTNFKTSTSTQNATVTVGPSLIVLNKTASGALQVTGTSTINVNGVNGGLVYVDSSSSSAVVASGSGKVIAAAGSQGGIHVVGGVSVSGGASLSPKPVTGATGLSDPLPDLQQPKGLPSQKPVNLSGSSTLTISPGTYSSISVTGNARLTLNPGVYDITGGFTVSNSAQVTGSGVLIYNAGGAINFSGTSRVQLSAATTGPYAGVVLYQPLGNTQTISLGNSAVQMLQGVVYASGALVSESGTDQFSDTSLVAYQVSIQGGGTQSSSTTIIVSS